jgi:hypothetical protein
LLFENFEELMKGKDEYNYHIIAELIKSLAKDIMNALDTRKE